MEKKRKWRYLKTFAAAMMLCTCLIAEPAAAAVNNGTVYPITSNEMAGWPQGPEVACETAVLMEADSGIILYNKGMDELRYPASITKIMTALLAIENCSLDTQVTFSETAVAAEQVAGSSTINMQVGEVITIRDCLFGLMIQSANEVAIQLAETVSGSEAAFAELMNCLLYTSPSPRDSEMCIRDRSMPAGFRMKIIIQQRMIWRLFFAKL